jgi:tRNA nucleotidyltransferase/poly(A) polymerase
MHKKVLTKHVAGIYEREARRILTEIRKRGYEANFVGGSVRDMLLGRDLKDIDLNTSAKTEKIKGILKQLGLPFFDLGEKFGTIGTLVKGGKVELTTYRSENSYSDFRHPDRVNFIDSLEEDLRRRDFTINALIYDPESRTVTDYVGGLTDLKAKRIVFIGEASVRIKEDPLRMLRAIRFATVLRFKIDVEALAAIKKHAKLIKKISGERIKEELDKVFSDQNYLHGFDLLDKSNLLKYILPEVDNLKKVVQSNDVHAEGNAFVHSRKVLSFMKNETLKLKFAGLFHDIGKYGTASRRMVDGRKRISFFGHAQKGEKMFQDIAKRYHFTRKERESISFLIKHHMDILHPEALSQKTIIKWAKKPYFEELIKLRIADTRASFMTDKEGKMIRKNFSSLYNLLEFGKEVQRVNSKKILSGDEVMMITGLKQGIEVGTLLFKLEEMQLNGKIKNKLDAKKFLKSLDKRKGLY